MVLEIKTPPKEAVRVKDMLKACIQCGTCTGSCPNAEFMDLTPRKMWRLALMDRLEPLFSSKTFILCSSCYYCTLRCPRGLELTTAMGLLKQAASKMDIKGAKRTREFYKAFMDSVEKHGRVRETEFMTQYFMAMKNPMLPLEFTPLGLKLMARGKMHFQSPFATGNKLSKLFQKTRELEG